jgi:hypothetical protein
VRGFVFDSAVKAGGAKAHAYAPLAANITVGASNWSVASGAQFGEYFRPLAPGRHVVRASCAGYAPAEVEVEVPQDGSGTVANFMLHRLSRPADEQQQQQQGGAQQGQQAQPQEQRQEQPKQQEAQEGAGAAAPGPQDSGSSSRQGGNAAPGEDAAGQQQQQQHGHLTGPSQTFGHGLGVGLLVALAVVVALAAAVAYRYHLSRQQQQQQQSPEIGLGRLSPARLPLSSRPESAPPGLLMSHKPLL